MLRHFAQPFHAAGLVFRIAWESSFRQPPDHVQDAVGDAFQLGVDLAQRARRLEDVEVAVERDFVADLGLLVVDPRIRHVGQDFTLEIGLHVLAQRHILGVAQGGVRRGLAFALALGAEHDLALGVALGRSTVMVR